MIECSKCLKWFHCNCVGVLERDLKKMKTVKWFCPMCSQIVINSLNKSIALKDKHLAWKEAVCQELKEEIKFLKDKTEKSQSNNAWVTEAVQGAGGPFILSSTHKEMKLELPPPYKENMEHKDTNIPAEMAEGLTPIREVMNSILKTVEDSLENCGGDTKLHPKDKAKDSTPIKELIGNGVMPLQETVQGNGGSNIAAENIAQDLTPITEVHQARPLFRQRKTRLSLKKK
ncbi:Transcription initiation factor TFIID subunit 3 [Frankliniella fusca]|uniref:Transcription initiation factor TFIID subunit 3 n=1 Tax=Frankliniella fusca TaxID=407009 RepID=A0AAE1HLI0_9NEOP|nr:Transcription initiation factor TFIID subunit 3 [Frankliniella fusca]